MAKRCLITRPHHDVPTAYLHDFSKELIKTVKATDDIHITDLEGPDANRANFEKSIIQEKPGLVFLNGHGGRKTVTGHKNEVILDKNNVAHTADKIVCALSCDSLEDLGQMAVTEGAKAYVGYKARFMLFKDPSRSSAPDKDKSALPFKRAYFALVSALVFGNTVRKAVELTKKEYLHSIKSYGTSDDDPYGDTPLIRFALAWNMEFLDAHGDLNAVFS